MATRMAEVPRPLVVGGVAKAKAGVVPEAFQRHAAGGLLAAGLLFLIGSLVDLGLLWAQRQPAPEWEFGALASTAEGMPRLVLGLALFYAALFVRGSTSLLGYRLMALALIATGVLGGLVAAMMASDYFVLRTNVNPDAQFAFRATIAKTVLLGGLHLVILVPLGVRGLRRPSS